VTRVLREKTRLREPRRRSRTGLERWLC